MTVSMSKPAHSAPPSTPLCSVGQSILADGGNPFAVGQAFAEHAEVCAACGNDALAGDAAVDEELR